jgi:1-acyl-sn-glycerol-3-phosphate acyltransferase
MGTFMNRGGRLLGTGVCFTLFGLGALLLSLVWFPLLWLFIRSPSRRQHSAQATIRCCFRAFLQLMSRLGVMSYQIEGAEILQQDSGCLLIANHPTLIDYVLLASVLPRCDCIVKQALWRNPFVALVVRAAGYLPNMAPERLLPLCEQQLAAGGVLLIFPEGTRTTPGQRPQLQRGAANIAVRCRADLRLAHIQCYPTTLTKQESWYHIPARKPHFQVTIREKIVVNNYLQAASTPAIAARYLTEFLTNALSPDEQGFAWERQ